MYKVQAQFCHILVYPEVNLMYKNFQQFLWYICPHVFPIFSILKSYFIFFLSHKKTLMLTDDVGIGGELQHTREWPRASAQGANKSMKWRSRILFADIHLVEFANW